MANKINMKVRMKSGVFWVGIIAAVAALASQVALLFNLDISSQVEQGVTIANMVLMILAGLGVISDPTVKGFGDSDLVLEKDAPTPQHRHVVEVEDEDEEIMGTDDQIISEVDHEDEILTEEDAK